MGLGYAVPRRSRHQAKCYHRGGCIGAGADGSAKQCKTSRNSQMVYLAIGVGGGEIFHLDPGKLAGMVDIPTGSPSGA